MKKIVISLLALTLSSALLSSASAFEYSVPNAFTAGSPIRASDMNANFQSIQAELRRIGGGLLFGTNLSDSGLAGFTLLNNSSEITIAGIVGKISAAGKYSSGVRGEDNTPGNLSYGVEGRSNTGTGVYGSSSSGAGLSGYSSSGSGVLARSSTGTALELDGAIKVSGTVRPAFVHTAAGGSHITCIDHTLTNGDPNAIVTFVHRWDAVYYTKPFGIYYTSGKWCIFSEDTSQLISAGTKFNVLVIKQ